MLCKNLCFIKLIANLCSEQSNIRRNTPPPVEIHSPPHRLSTTPEDLNYGIYIESELKINFISFAASKDHEPYSEKLFILQYIYQNIIIKTLKNMIVYTNWFLIIKKQ
ncbi:hypothetical protein T07_1373 [Trichinella nelsoni]|uniref:Uncharacterized protein n=1 Tax=Trichinella nelsoni TaxID=6336 RepID=A0A0V0RGS6_9BILA|nr:hypothetical protein T07_1373 [Trichinella nelsoni]